MCPEERKPGGPVNANDEDGDESETEETVQEDQQQANQIFQSGSVTPEGGRHKIHVLTIIGQVEGHYTLPPQNKTTKYEHVIPQLVAIEQDDSIKGLLIILNTVGGDVEAGLAIAELVAGMRKPTVSLVLGGGHSIGVPLAVSPRFSFIAPTATMTVHPVRMNGIMLGVPQTLSYFDKMQERITNFVCANSNITPERFKHLMMNNGELVMDIGTVLDGKDAVEEGLIDSLGGLHEAIEKLYDFIEEEEAAGAAQEPGEEPSADEEPPAKKRRGRKPGGKKPPEEKSGGDAPGENPPAGEEPPAKKRRGRKPGGKKPPEETSDDDTPDEEPPAGKKPGRKKSGR